MGNERNEGDVLLGQQFDPRDEFIIPYTQQELSKPVADKRIGDPNTEITPTDKSASMVKVYDAAAILAELLDEFYSYPGTTNFSLPDVLTNLAIVYSSTSGAGDKVQEAGYAVSSGDHGGLDISANSTAQASAAIIPDLTYTIRSFFTQNVPCTNAFFNLAGDEIDWSDIQTKLAAKGYADVQPWPQFKPVELNFVLKGAQISINASAASQHFDRWSDSNLSASFYPYPGQRSDGTSREVGLTSKTVRILPTLHGAFTLSPTSSTSTATVTVKANIPAIVGTGTAPSFAAVTNEPTPATVTATATVSPTSVTATTPAAIPSSGLYARVQIDKASWGVFLVHAEIVDFSQFV